MPDIQEVIALGIVALVGGLVVYRRLVPRQTAGKSGSCGDCASSGPPPNEATVHFYRRRTPDSKTGS